MAYEIVTMENPHTGEMREAPLGFSWTVLFFGAFPALFRGDWKWFFIMLFIGFLTFGFSGLVFMFIYNKLHMKELIMKGFKAKSTSYDNFDKLAARAGINIPVLNTGNERLSASQVRA